jgi:flagellar hook assembly protein FlgD
MLKMRESIGHIWAVLPVCVGGIIVLSLLYLCPQAQVASEISEIPNISSSISVTVTVTSGKSETILPDAFALYQNYPNPFNPETVIKYALPEDCQVELTIYNILGQKVKAMVDEFQSAGFRMVHWDGRDDKGNQLASGVYFCKITAGKYVDVKKMTVLR